jgi:hypothetical protein
LFDQVLQIALQAGTMKLGRVVSDGSKVKANASKHKAMSYGRMQEEEKRLKEEVKRLLEQAEATDAEEDTRYGRDRTGDELPAELARRETRLKRIQEAKRALEERAREEAKSKGKPEEKAQPKAKMQYNFTDPESRIMPGVDGFVQAYNTQIAVESDFQWIVGQRVTQATNDKQQLAPTICAILLSSRTVALTMRLRGPLPQGATRVDRMRRKLQTKVGAAWAMICLTHNILKLHRPCYG